MTPIILATVIVVWQAVLVGYTFMLAGNAADRAVHAGAQKAAWEDLQAVCEEAGKQDVPNSWRGGTEISCSDRGDDLIRAEVHTDVPLLFPGFVNLPLTIDGKSAAAKES